LKRTTDICKKNIRLKEHFTPPSVLLFDRNRGRWYSICQNPRQLSPKAVPRVDNAELDSKLTPSTGNQVSCYGSFEESSPISRKKFSSILVGASKNRTAGSQASLGVCDKGKPGESRRRKATRLQRISMRHASRAAESHYTGERFMRAFILAVTGLAISVTACSSYGTSVVETNNPSHVASVSLALPASLAAGQTARAVATIKDQNGAVLSGRPITWYTSSASIASVNDSGVIAAVAPGAAVVSAVSEGVAGQKTMTVLPPIPTPVANLLVALNPSAVLVGQTAHATAVPEDSLGNPLSGRTVTWQSTNSNVAVVTSAGDVSAVAAGTTSIKGTSEGKTASAALTVSAPAPVPVATVSVSPTSSSLQVGATAQLSATTRDANNNVLTGRVIGWSSANTGIASVSSSGLVSAISAGTTQITVSSEGQSAIATITVSATAPVPVASVSVSPTAPSLQVGATVQLSATTRDASNNVLTGRVITWSSANAGIASVSSSGLVSAISAGTAQVTVTSEGKSAIATITVTAPAPPPPPPPGGSNEPTGLTAISDRPFNSTTSTYTAGEDGWWDNDNGGGMTIVQDATAPKSPSSVGRMNYPAGFSGGNSPGSVERQVNVTTLYVATWVKFSSNWQSHPSGVNKILHLWINGANRLVITAAGYVSDGPLTARISLQGISAGGNNSDGSGTYESNAQFIRGQWHKIEVIAVANTSGAANGSVKLYIDGVLATSCSGIAFVSGSANWDLAMWSPTWGGAGATVAATQYMEMDHIYLSGQ
jgi:uncharacterized protein YjdB